MRYQRDRRKQDVPDDGFAIVRNKRDDRFCLRAQGIHEIGLCAGVEGRQIHRREFAECPLIFLV